MSQSLQALPAVLPRASGDTSPALVCSPVFDEICINANGDIVCSSCDVNGQRVYGNVFKDRIGDVYNGPMYQEMREWLLRSRPDTWCPAIKHQCPRRTTLAHSGLKTSNCHVKVLKLEPVTYCNLECPACPVELQFKQNPFLRDTRGRKLLGLANHARHRFPIARLGVDFSILISVSRSCTKTLFRSCAKCGEPVPRFELQQIPTGSC